jgi:hypothetical protein
MEDSSRSVVGWLLRPRSPGTATEQATAPWYWTLWLASANYFSSLGYAPYLAVAAAGYLAPVATLLLVLVTLLCALPTYAFVARHSHEGEGAIKMIERLTVRWGRLGWMGKVLVLALIGFAMTDFVLTIAISAADATQHLLHNPFLSFVPDRPILVAAAIIVAVGLVFLRGFGAAISLAAAIAIPYMVLNAIVIGASIAHLVRNPLLVSAWWEQVRFFDPHQLGADLARISAADVPRAAQLGLGGIIAVGLVVFPKLALGLSGFETAVSAMPHIRANDLRERVIGTRKLLAAAATLLSIELLGASFVSAVAIPTEAFWALGPDGLPGAARGRALAWLAHEHLGSVFGTIYDVSTVAILAFAGASAMAALLDILPRYLPRFGMAPSWLEHRRPLVLLFTGLCLSVNAAFRADVAAQGAAYATSVIAMMASGAFAVFLAESAHTNRRRIFWVVCAVFLYMLLVNVWERPEGIQIAAMFVTLTVIASVWSRWVRASELRVQSIRFVDDVSEHFWLELKGIDDVVLVPLRSPTAEARASSEARVIHPRKSPNTVYAFLHVTLLEDTSKFQSPIRVSVSKSGNDYVIEVQDAVAVANAIAFVGLELDVSVVIIGLLDTGTPLANALLYLLLGTGEIGYAVRSIFMRQRQDWLNQHSRMLERFDRERDRIESEALRDMVVLEDAERKEKLEEMFALEQKRFAEQLPTLRRLPHLIMFE